MSGKSDRPGLADASETTDLRDDFMLNSRDELLVSLLDRVLETSRGASSDAFESIVREHPELEIELRELWATMQIADDFANVSELYLDEPTNRPQSQAASSTPPQDCGDYELLEEIGRGGMGVVYRARQKSLDRIVALKMILRGDDASSSDIARFRAEAESAAQLHHPNIINVYEVGEFEGRPYFSMKLIEGTTLAKRLAEGPLPSRLAAEMLAPICRAIGDAHRRGVLHRDLKPSNILIDNESRTYVSDFGLAKRLSTVSANNGVDGPTDIHLTLTGAILGTPGYMAPEQAAGRRGQISAATDVYALGAILYAMLTGRPPFQAASAIDTVLMVREQDPLPPRMLNPKADADLEMICLKCLQKPADLRYSSADALADDLDAFLNSEPISARSTQLSQIISLAFRETHHAAILENWGLLWMWHSLVVVLICFITNWMHLSGIESRWPYATMWSVGTTGWALIFWELRRRSGPITFVERQIAHVWAGSVGSSMFLYGLEWLMNLEVLKLSPILPLTAGNVFIAKAGILSGKFYVQAVALYATSILMAIMQQNPATDYGVSLMGLVLGSCFFFPGLKYHRQRKQTAASD
jgi:serine/threonine-protein kinase